MVQEKVMAQERPAAVLRVRPRRERDVCRKEMMSVLERAARDIHFIAQLTHNGQEALQGYDLSWQEKAALLSGDIRWVEARLGTLSPRLRTWLDCRLEQERW